MATPAVIAAMGLWMQTRAAMTVILTLAMDAAIPVQ
jgi:hypothetical protein